MAETGGGKTTRNLAKRTHEMLMDRGNIDYKTGILNARGVISTAEKMISQIKREGLSPQVSVIMMDMIGLKQLNKDLSEKGANVVIKEATGSMQMSIRGSDLLGRWSLGDEFVILAFDTDSVGTKKLIGKIKDSLPEKAKFNFIFKTFETITDLEEMIDNVHSQMEKAKATLDKDYTGRATGNGIVKELF